MVSTFIWGVKRIGNQRSRWVTHLAGCLLLTKKLRQYLHVRLLKLITQHRFQVGFWCSAQTADASSIWTIYIGAGRTGRVGRMARHITGVRRLSYPTPIAMSAIGRGCVKTFSSRVYGLSRSKNRAPTQISGQLTSQTPTDFK